MYNIEDLYFDACKNSFMLFSYNTTKKYIEKYPMPENLSIDYLIDSGKLYEFIYQYEIKEN